MKSALHAAVRRPIVFTLVLTAAALGIASVGFGWADLWATADQRGRFLFTRGQYQAAADAFVDPVWRGGALMRAGNFKDAAQAFAGVDTVEGAYDEGNALVMLGKYAEAIARYDRALAERPEWREAQGNRAIAQARAERLKAPGGDAGEQREGADQIVYDKDAKRPDGEATETAGAPMSDAEIRALWLKRVETRPADFLRARFAYQLQAAEPPAGAK
ncbi:tetratricopeptide repeat protein [Aquabacter sp. CN5-332]|uniref:tetratricopeptide repeat protein n=1 Tax=Aquabacter sp. CN5-332 TaxID=3156608 RepID=UPI0032B5E0F9